MQIVIDLPNGYSLLNIKNGSIASQMILNAVKAGTVLPEHDDLVDIKVLEETFEKFWKERRKNGISMCYADIGTIIDCHVPRILKHNP